MGRKIIDITSRCNLWNEDTPTSKPTMPEPGIQPERLVMAREFLGLTQQEFAAKIEASTEDVQRWESGEVLPDRKQMQRIILLAGAFKPAWFKKQVDVHFTIEETSLRFHKDEKPDLQQNGVPGWAKDIPPNDYPPTTRKPDKCSGCATPIWRWYHPDPARPGEWRCCNCLIYQIKYNKESGLKLTLEECKASGVYRDDYLYYEEER